VAGRSGGDDTELVPMDELARRFSLDRVGHSPGVFDEEKLAWANRHYLKIADPARVADLALPYFEKAGLEMRPDAGGLAYLASIMTIATSSVDRLDQIPERLDPVFHYLPEKTLSQPSTRAEMAQEKAGQVVRALAEELGQTPRLDRERFRLVANEVKKRTGQKGKDLFHPIRVALTGMPAGAELDLLIPAIDRGAELPADAGLPPILGCRERAAAFVRALDQLA
jgi:glutamyl-tRNA synthetase/nondiscriminating glutamyl-tRNA synthetase